MYVNVILFAELGKAMTPGFIDASKTTYVCTLCDLVLDKIDRIKYHVICHHWKLRPYVCPLCDTYKVKKNNNN